MMKMQNVNMATDEKTEVEAQQKCVQGGDTSGLAAIHGSEVFQESVNIDPARSFKKQLNGMAQMELHTVSAGIGLGLGISGFALTMKTSSLVLEKLGWTCIVRL